MLHFVNHTQNLRSSDNFAGVINFSQAKGLKSSFLISRMTYFTSNLFDSQFLFCHF